jgi:DnaJ-class molecular chaperone
MANLKKRRHSGICPDCKGNGYISNKSRELIMQCETCDSEGEIYVDESEVVEFYLDDDTSTSDVVKLH